MRALLAAGFAALLGTAAPAQACRMMTTPAERISTGYERRLFSAVATVSIVRSSYIRAPFADAHPWKATAKINRVLRGAYPASTVDFERGWGTAACDDGLPPPTAGEKWVVYFRQHEPGDQRVWQAYPANIAYAADPRLGQDVR